MANRIPRVPVREQDPALRATNFEEVCYGYNLEEATLEASRCLHCKNPRCVAACPVGISIPEFIAALHAGDLQGAADTIARDSSLPSICGRVCPQETQREGACVLGVKGEPLAIGKLERFVGARNLAHGAPPAAPPPRHAPRPAPRPLFCSMAQTGKLAACAAIARVSALNKVDLPTCGKPTIPQLNPIKNSFNLPVFENCFFL